MLFLPENVSASLTNTLSASYPNPMPSAAPGTSGHLDRWPQEAGCIVRPGGLLG